MGKRIVVSWCRTCGRKLRQTFAGSFMHAVGGWKDKQPECETGPIPGGQPPGKYVRAKEERIATARQVKAFKQRQRQLEVERLRIHFGQ